VCPNCFSSPHQSAPQIDWEHSILVNSHYSWNIYIFSTSCNPISALVSKTMLRFMGNWTRKLAFSTSLLQLQKREKIPSTKLHVTMTSLDIWSNLRNTLSRCGIIFSLSIIFHNSKVESISLRGRAEKWRFWEKWRIFKGK
jgi:hypothetical protein